jgi:hypothetical protein
MSCSSLTSATIAEGVISIDRNAFYNCIDLTSITIAEDNLNYKSIDGNLYSKDGTELIQYATGKTVTSFTIPEGVITIDGLAFDDCIRLASITIPDSVIYIGYSAFSDCSSLASVYYTGDISGWCNIKFGGYHSNPLTYAHNLYINNELVTNLIIPDSVTSIGEYAFYGCSSLTSVTIGNGVTSIGRSAFSYCRKLTNITIPDSVTYIGDSAFAGCSSLTSITFENTSGWWASTSSTATSGTSISSDNLSDTETAAEYLTDTYCRYYWKRAVEE